MGSLLATLSRQWQSSTRRMSPRHARTLSDHAFYKKKLKSHKNYHSIHNEFRNKERSELREKLLEVLRPEERAKQPRVELLPSLNDEAFD